MARGSNARRRGERDTSDIPSDALDSLLSPVRPSLPVRRFSTGFPLSQVEDQRRFDFAPRMASARRLDGTPARIVGSVSGPAVLPATKKPAPGAVREVATPRVLASRGVLPAVQKFGFADPQHTLVCVRRKTRREVLFAIGKRASGGGRRRRTPYSEVIC